MDRQGRRQKIAAALAAVWPDQGRRFVTIEDPRDLAVFLQYLDGQLNMAWPTDADPRTELTRRGAPPPAEVQILSWSPHGALLMHTGDLRPDQVADWIDTLVDRVLDVPAPNVRIDCDR